MSVEERASQGGAVGIQAEAGGLSGARYVQITRTGTSFSAATSTDGVTWTPIVGASVTLSALSGPLLGGIAVSAHNPAALSAVRVEHVTTSSGGGLSAPSGVTTATTSASDNDAGS